MITIKSPETGEIKQYLDIDCTRRFDRRMMKTITYELFTNLLPEEIGSMFAEGLDTYNCNVYDDQERCVFIVGARILGNRVYLYTQRADDCKFMLLRSFDVLNLR